MSKKIEHIVILGADTHAWSSAARLSIALRGLGVRISVVGKVQRAENSILSLGLAAHQFHRELGISEAELIAEVGGSYRYATDLIAWQSPESHRYFSLSPAGELINNVPFHSYVSYLKLSGHEIDLAPFCIASVAASENKFSHPNPDSKFDKIDYALQLDGNRYLNYLKAFSIRLGVRSIDADLKSAEVDSFSACVNSVLLSNGETLDADFYFDARGGVGSLIEQFLGVSLESWQSCCPLNQRVDIVQRVDCETPVTNTVEKREYGIRKISSIPGGKLISIYFSDQWADSQQVEKDTKVDISETTKMDQSSTIEFGVRRDFWRGNCISIGAAAGFVGSWFFDPIELTHTALERWLALYPSLMPFDSLALEYNRLTHMEYISLRDVNLMLSATAKTQDGPFDRFIQSSSWPDSLLHRISLFVDTGKVAFNESDSLKNYQWVSLMTACGLWPRRIEPLLPNVSQAKVESTLSSIREDICRLVDAFPKHDDLLNGIRHIHAQNKKIS